MFADANILIRYIINDDEIMAAKADEAVYVLTKVYGIERSDVADSMIE